MPVYFNLGTITRACPRSDSPGLLWLHLQPSPLPPGTLTLSPLHSSFLPSPSRKKQILCCEQCVLTTLERDQACEMRKSLCASVSFLGAASLSGWRPGGHCAKACCPLPGPQGRNSAWMNLHGHMALRVRGLPPGPHPRILHGVSWACWPWEDIFFLLREL